MKPILTIVLCFFCINCFSQLVFRSDNKRQLIMVANQVSPANSYFILTGEKLVDTKIRITKDTIVNGVQLLKLYADASNQTMYLQLPQNLKAIAVYDENLKVLNNFYCDNLSVVGNQTTPNDLLSNLLKPETVIPLLRMYFLHF